jgi:serine protease Do
MKRTLIFSGVIALVVSLLTIGVFQGFQTKKQPIKVEYLNTTPSKSAVYTVDEEGNVHPLDFTQTAEKVVDAVVNIKSTQSYAPESGYNPQERQIPDPFRDFFRDFFDSQPDQRMRPQPRVGSGSGVIINESGYIVTNNHVVANADDIEVTLYDNRTYKATVIGTDPTTDLALIQIKEKDLPTIPFVNSDEVKVGEWVMAVGNPFSLNSTVTAGIVSAKGRNINILREQFAIESFIQTDAAINPGNSGGALVDLDGGLVGINTAIASPTGAYSGYGFAVPSNIVSKVVEDLLNYGVVQRGVLGVMIRSVDGSLIREKDLDITNGAYVDSLLENSAAAEAGIIPGDVIVKVNDMEVISSPSLQEAIARYRPGDKVAVTVIRDGKERTFNVILNNRKGDREIVKKEKADVLNVLGAEIEALSADEAQKLDIPGGVKVSKLYAGKIRKHTQMREGFIITKVDGKKITSEEEFITALEGKKGGVMVEGIYEDIPGEYYYAFGM